MARANPGSQIQINTDFTQIAGDYPSKEQTLGRGKAQDPKLALENLLGTTLKFTPATSVNLDTREGYAHSTTGIPYAISGTATVVSQKVGAWLAGFQDPIKAILGVGVHTNNKIIIKRKYVIGGSATITPERAPARTVAIKEDVREVSLTRYGGDIEMNLNLFLRPGDAEEELTMKLDAQKRELERKLVDLGYMCLMQEGTPIIDAIIRSNPTMGAPTNAQEAERYYRTAKRIYCNNIFGALNKHRFPVANLLSAARYASAYSTGTQKGSVMILPHGIPDLLRYSRKENMSYAVSGLKSGHNGKIDMKLQGSFEDPNSGVAILIHHPTPTYEHGVAKPNISIESGGLTDETIVASKHTIKKAPRGDITRALWENEMYWGTGFAQTKGVNDEASRRTALGIELLAAHSRDTGDHFDPARRPTGSWPVVTFTGSPNGEAESSMADVVNGGYLAGTSFTTIANMAGSFMMNRTAKHNWTVTRSSGDIANARGPRTFNGVSVKDDTNLTVGDHSLTTEAVKFSLKAGVSPADVNVYRIARVVASSAILAAPGSQTGELLIGYPFTGVSTSHAEERMRIQLRCYLGAALYQPDNVLIMPNVFVEGVTECVYYAEPVIETEVPSTLTGVGAELKLDMYAFRKQSFFDSVGAYVHHGDTGRPVNWMDYGCNRPHPLMAIDTLDEYTFCFLPGATVSATWADAFSRDPAEVRLDATRMAVNAGVYAGMSYQKMENDMVNWCGAANRANMMMWRELHCMMAVILHPENLEENEFAGSEFQNLQHDESSGSTRKRDKLVREMTAFHHIYASSPVRGDITLGGGTHVITNPVTPQHKRGCYEVDEQAGIDPIRGNTFGAVRNPLMNLARCATILDWLSPQFDRLPDAVRDKLESDGFGKSKWATTAPCSLSLSELLNWRALNAVEAAITSSAANFDAVPSLQGVLRSEGVTGHGRYFNTAEEPISISDVNDLMGDWPQATALGKPSQGATFNRKTGLQLDANNGEFGELDHPTKYAILHGAPQSFEGGQHTVGSGPL
jgi:hypothetical protein